MLFALCLIPLGGEIAQADAIKMNQYETGDTDNVQVYGGHYYAQSFTASDTYIVSSVKVKLFKTWAGTAGTIYVGIYDITTLGVPDIDSPVTTVGSISSSSITTSATGAC